MKDKGFLNKLLETIRNFATSIFGEETFFIDDTEEHINAAKKLGLRTHLLKKGDGVLDVFHIILKPNGV